MISMRRHTRRILSSFLLAGAVGSGVAPAARAQNVPTPLPSLVTSGQGEAKVTPDRASILVNVQTRSTTAAASASENAQKTRAVIDALLKLGLPKDQVTTEGYSVYPEMRYDNTGGSPRVTGYVVTNTVRAETHRPEQAGSIVDAALGAGANVINSLSFYASTIEEPRRQAIALAVASARADAEAMARAAGGSLGGLLELSTQGPTMPPRPMFDAGMLRAKVAQSEPTPINAGQLTITVFVTARWQFVSAR
jgi:uncharacterized protein YggE